MKTWNWAGGGAAAPPQKASTGWWARVVEVLSRGEIPVDGFTVEQKKQPEQRNPEPVRWGNFR